MMTNMTSPPKTFHSDAVARACRHIEAAEETPDLETLAREAAMSKHHFLRVFKAETGVTPGAYAAAVKARRLRELLAAPGMVTAAVYEAGYGSSGRFYESAGERLGMAPRRYQARGQGEIIRFAVGACSLGQVLVAATDKGICAIFLGDDPEKLVRDLQDRFAKAELRGAEKAFETWVAKVIGMIEAPQTGLGLPLDIRGTAFQERVWRALRALPPGQTATYAGLAASLGLPKAARAVAGACAANPLAVAIPCHRVIRQDGELAGYRWGLDRKRVLLERERKGINIR